MKAVAIKFFFIFCVSSSYAYADPRKDESEVKTQAITVPSGLKSINSDTKLKIFVNNNRNEAISLYWVNYDGAAVKILELSPNSYGTLYGYGTQPWIIANAADDIIAYFVPYTSDLTITVSNQASSW